MSSPTEDHAVPDFSSSPTRPPLQPPPEQPSTAQSIFSTISYFTEPVSYTVSGLLRRLSEDEAPTPLAKALSANWNGSMTDPTTGVYHPPPVQPFRRLSPFQPPPLTPLTLRGYRDTTPSRARLLRRAISEEIRLLLPPRLQLVDHWQLIYSLEQNGSTLSTLYNLCDAHRGKRGGFVLVVRDSDHSSSVFGAYLSDAPKPTPSYYGSGECFLWRAIRVPAPPPVAATSLGVEGVDLASLPPPPSADTTHLGRVTTVGIPRTASSTSLQPSATPERIRFKAFPYTGENDFSIFCQPEYLSIGGGNGKYGLWLDGGLSQGVSDTCPTFGNEALSEEGTKFEVLGVEVWYVGS